MSYTVLKISDGEHTYPFLYEDGMLYWPDYNPNIYNEDKYPIFKMSFYKWVGGLQTEPQSFIINAMNCRACVPFRHMEYTYSQCSEVVGAPRGNMYIEFIAIKSDGTVDENWVPTQGATLKGTNVLYIDVLDPRTYQPTAGSPEFRVRISPLRENTLAEVLKDCYGGSDIYTTWEAAVVDENDVYWWSENVKPIDNETVAFPTSWQFKKSFEYIDKLKIIAVCKNTIVSGGHEMHVDIKSAPLPITEDIYNYMLAVQDGMVIEPLNQPGTALYNMQISKPRIMDKTVQNVMEITAHTDSKANIIQPVFFRTREMAQILVHPEVTENIAINLDPYKSQVNRFIIKIEGIMFPEIGRVEGGVIFKVKGSLLPNAVKSGTYYILNQDADLVTTGKYIYEY